MKHYYLRDFPLIAALEPFDGVPEALPEYSATLGIGGIPERTYGSDPPASPICVPSAPPKYAGLGLKGWLVLVQAELI